MVLTSGQQKSAQNRKFFEDYTSTINRGIANPTHMKRYQDVAKEYGWNTAQLKPTNTFKAPLTPGQKQSASNRQFFEDYTSTIKRGIANPTHIKRYQDTAKEYGWKVATPDHKMMQDLSIKALSGDTKAQQWLNAMKYKPLSGADLWKGYDTSKLQQGTKPWGQYYKDNPTSQIAKDYDMKLYESFKNKILNNEALTDAQQKQYQDLIARWNMDDWSNPLVQEKDQLEKDKQAALAQQDAALNQSMVTMDGNNFQLFQELQQQMSDRGITGSGIEQDAYGQMQSAANRDYQDAFMQAANAKTGVTRDYNDRISQTKQEIEQQRIAKEQQAWENEMAENESQTKAQQEAAKMQLERDKFLTASSGIMYINGKPLTANGRPITTVEFQKLTETQRHNLATENNVANKTQLDYLLGRERNAISQEGHQLDYAVGMAKIQADIQKASANLELGYAKLDQGYAKIEADMNKAKASLDVAARKAATSEQKNMITGIKGQLDSLQKQIKAQKDGKATKKQKEQYNALMKRLDDVLTGKL
jgi:hypothetical protein